VSGRRQEVGGKNGLPLVADFVESGRGKKDVKVLEGFEASSSEGGGKSFSQGIWGSGIFEGNLNQKRKRNHSPKGQKRGTELKEEGGGRESEASR